MAVMRNNLIFGGVNSADYGIYISGEGVFDAPKRDVEMIDIPGRNGSFALDKGRFENITVTYPAFNYEDNLADFEQNLSGFRNAVCSQVGYQKLTDSFHPTEYRMATYISGLEIKPVMYNTASTFDIVFECKPQRWMMSGEEALPVADGETVFNPTLFDANPLLEVDGYGSIGIGAETVTVQNAQLGEIQISEAASSASVTLDTTNLNADDSIINKSVTQPYVDITLKTTTPSISYYSASMQGDYDRAHGSAIVSGISANSFKVRVIPKISGFVKGTDFSMTIKCFIAIQPQPNGTSYSSLADVTVAYVASTDTVSLSVAFSAGPSPSGTTASYQYMHPAYYGNSTKNILPSPMYIDLDIGEAYGIVNGSPLSFNNVVEIPAELPTLKPGENTITFDNTVTDLKIVPRWWKI